MGHVSGVAVTPEGGFGGGSRPGGGLFEVVAVCPVQANSANARINGPNRRTVGRSFVLTSMTNDAPTGRAVTESWGSCPTAIAARKGVLEPSQTYRAAERGVGGPESVLDRWLDGRRSYLGTRWEGLPCDRC